MVKQDLNKEILINLIGVMIEINKEERNSLNDLSKSELEHKYKLLIKEKSEEML